MEQKYPVRYSTGKLARTEEVIHQISKLTGHQYFPRFERCFDFSE